VSAKVILGPNGCVVVAVGSADRSFGTAVAAPVAARRFAPYAHICAPALHATASVAAPVVWFAALLLKATVHYLSG
jgi:hypothetical protein